MKLTGWGRFPIIQARGRSFNNQEALGDYLKSAEDCIAHGMGRSYGDSALNEQVIFTRRFNKILNFDPQTGAVVCESGVSLAELIDAFLPRGWFLGVVPGTKFISVGGAIASDVHGKNHHRAGCFSEHVLAFDLMLPQGEVVRCSRQENAPLFHATCGGMGLTGVILRAELGLEPIQSAYIRETLIPGPNLEDVINLFEENRSAAYSVAWIDCLAKNEHQGRSIVMLGEPAEAGPLALPPSKTWTVPLGLPGFCLNKYSVSMFNYFYYQLKSNFVAGRLVPLDEFFFPLDKIAHWNKLYGRRGFTQYQLVLPKDAGLAGLRVILGRIAATGLGSFLAVLKLFGAENANYLSFPLEGYTLALDFKIQNQLFPFLNELDRIVLDHGGRLYLTKDVRMSREVFQKGYSRWEQFAQIREQYHLIEKFNSLQSKRLGV
jgi:decaprenylphospho-beta-D-ribofuranose 2-oxidase